MKPTVRSEYVAGGAHSLRSQGGDDGGGNGGGGAGGGLLTTLPIRDAWSAAGRQHSAFQN